MSIPRVLLLQWQLTHRVISTDANMGGKGEVVILASTDTHLVLAWRLQDAGPANAHLLYAGLPRQCLRYRILNEKTANTRLYTGCMNVLCVPVPSFVRAVAGVSFDITGILVLKRTTL